MHEPLYSAAEMRAAEERYPGYPDTTGELMERAGAAVANEVLRAFPEARRIAVVCGGGANGGDGRIAARILREAGRDAVETDEPGGADLVVDALFGTGFRGAPRPDAAALIERIAASGARSSRSTCRRASTRRRERSPERPSRPTSPSPSTVARSGSPSHPGGSRRERWSSRTSGSTPRRPRSCARRPRSSGACPRRSAGDTKFTAGSVLVVGGSRGTTSAAVLAATAALRADAGYVTLAVPAECLAVAETLALEPVKRAFEWASALETSSTPTSAVRRRSRSARASAGRRRPGRSSVTCSSARRSRPSSTRTGCSGSSPSVARLRSC